MTRRRHVILAGAAGLAAATYGASWLPRLWEGPLETSPLAEPEGFRRLAGGPTSSGMSPWAGLDGGPARAEPEIDLCTALFGEAAPNTLQIASFSDYNCPYCRVMTRRVATLAEEMRLPVRWHELPLLGDTSLQAARAALAADRQGKYAEFHERLMRTSFQPTPAYLQEIGESAGLDPERLLNDMYSDAVTERIRTSAAVAGRFGIAGTPALVVGGTLVEGVVEERTLRRLVALERRDGGGPCE